MSRVRWIHPSRVARQRLMAGEDFRAERFQGFEEFFGQAYTCKRDNLPALPIAGVDGRADLCLEEWSMPVEW